MGYPGSNVKTRLEQSNYYLASGRFPLENAIYDNKHLNLEISLFTNVNDAIGYQDEVAPPITNKHVSDCILCLENSLKPSVLLEQPRSEIAIDFYGPLPLGEKLLVITLRG